jgi:hypothetical protein
MQQQEKEKNEKENSNKDSKWLRYAIIMRGCLKNFFGLYNITNGN